MINCLRKHYSCVVHCVFIVVVKTDHDLRSIAPCLNWHNSLATEVAEKKMLEVLEKTLESP